MKVDTKQDDNKMRYLEPPSVRTPINAQAGLYMYVLSGKGHCEASQLLAFVADDVRRLGYDPDGRAELGMACCYGVVSRAYSLWFYQKLARSQE